jgi:3-oxoacyl-[acyl-carrier-protein] synthase I
MPVAPVAVMAVGLVSGVGLTAEESCAAIRCGMNNFQETRFISTGGHWLVGSEVELEPPQRGIAKLAKMSAQALGECLAATDHEPEQIPVLIGIAEPNRPGRFKGLSHLLLHEIERELGFPLHPHSRVVEQGRVAGVVALLQARRMLSQGQYPRIIVAGVDTYLSDQTLAAYEREDRLLTRTNSNGFIPGEAAGAVLLAARNEGMATPLLLRGLGFAREPAPLGSGGVLRADGLVQAIRGALDEAGIGMQDCDIRIADANGEQYRFKEAALAITRLLRERKVPFSLWHLADCVGEVGAATLPVMVATLFTGSKKNYLPGPIFLGHVCGDDDRRAAFVSQATVVQTLALETAAHASFTLKRRAAL